MSVPFLLSQVEERQTEGRTRVVTLLGTILLTGRYNENKNPGEAIQIVFDFTFHT
jgi:hypothetical protein